MEKPRKFENSTVGAVRAQAGSPLRSTPAKTLVDVHSGLKFAKSPRWTGQELVFLDIHDRSIKSVDLQGKVRTVRNLSYLPGGLDMLANGELLVGDAWQRKIYRWGETGSKMLADLSDVTGYCLSDSIVDSRGGMYVGDAGFDFLDPLKDPVPNGIIVYVTADGNVSIVAADLFFPNGMIVTQDNETLIVAETLARRLLAFDISNDGSLHNRRVWAQFEDDVKPDGICLDNEGAVWVAGSGLCALRVREGGEVDHQIATKRPVVAVTLGGPEKRHLLLCTSDSDDPVITRRVPGATIDIAEVTIPGNTNSWRHVCDGVASALDTTTGC